MTNGVERFSVAVPGAELDDLRRRLEAARWPERETGPAQGIGLDRLRGLCDRWAQTYDWRRLEGRLNAVEQGRFPVAGLRVHFLHARSSEPDATPLLLTHGWPGSVVELLDVLEPLTRAGFHCIVPSLPGYGWSEKPGEVGWTVQRTADAWAALMAGLGYDRYLAQGSWVGEKLLSWTDPREPLSDEQVLDGLSVYWFTRTGASAARLYWESLADVDRWLGGPLEAHDLVDAPTGCSVFPYELQRPTRAEAEVRFRNIRHWGTPGRGGHFPAWEQPASFVEEITALRAAL